MNASLSLLLIQLRNTMLVQFGVTMKNKVSTVSLIELLGIPLDVDFGLNFLEILDCNLRCLLISNMFV